MKSIPILALGIALCGAAAADNSTLEAAIGGGLGGAAGAAIGNELGGREGAIIGGAIGGGAGAAIATDPDRQHRQAPRTRVEHHRAPSGHPYRFCPPGQAKKGRC